MERRNFLRNALMAIAVSLVPKILQPIDIDNSINQNFFDAAFKGRPESNPFYKKAYFCDIGFNSSFSGWLDEYFDL